MKHYLLFYELVEDYMTRRGEFRDAHLARAWQASEDGTLVVAGALADPVDQAILLFRSESREAVERFAESDPYVLNGLVKSWTVREWTTVAGGDAIMPVHPSGD